MLTEYVTLEMGTATERHKRNALKFGTSGEVDSKEGWAFAKGLVVVPPNCSELVAPQEKFNGSVGEALIL